MESELKPQLKEKVSNIFQDFLIRVTKLEELAGIGSRLLNGYQQALALFCFIFLIEFLRQPPIDGTSQLIKNIIKANETRRVKSYIEAGCINVHDSIQNTNKCKSKSKTLLNELENLLEDSSCAIQTANGCLPPLKNEDCSDQLYQQITTDQVHSCYFYLVEKSSLDLGELEMTNYAVLMGIIYSMVKQDYAMQINPILARQNLEEIADCGRRISSTASDRLDIRSIENTMKANDIGNAIVT
ncbi:hypothetical protein DKX38_027095 [Salix brachista]|uniref:DUF7795 domain-containing protein n=1 Tax=Salix brachista TaxID=2182728 RepID=A0A5N5JN16_9ROSI|nr:hypothetical protein DKX38_027095 [Salix brachista]